MTAIRDLVETLGITPDTFDILIYIVIIVGVIWAVRRLYLDLTSPPLDDEEERVEPITIKLGKSKDDQ